MAGKRESRGAGDQRMKIYLTFENETIILNGPT